MEEDLKKKTENEDAGNKVEKIDIEFGDGGDASAGKDCDGGCDTGEFKCGACGGEESKPDEGCCGCGSDNANDCEADNDSDQGDDSNEAEAETDEKSDVNDAECADAGADEGSEPGAENEACGEDEEQEKKSFFKDRKNVKVKKELAKKDEQIAELTDRLRRTAAEFDNFRKRTEKEKAVRYDDGAMGVLEKILPVIDNFERGLSQVAEDQKSDPFVEGMEKIYKHFLTILEGVGVKPMDAAGKEFDPNLHNAVMHVDDESLGENVVAEELQKGYMYKDNVLRHSMVKVAN